MPGRRPRTEIISKDEHKVREVETPDGLALSLPELVHVLRLRAHLNSHQELADAARRFLPEWVSMNRRIIQQIERGDIPADEVNDVWLLAIAAACGASPSVFGLQDLGDSGDLAKMLDLIDRSNRKLEGEGFLTSRNGEDFQETGASGCSRGTPGYTPLTDVNPFDPWSVPTLDQEPIRSPLDPFGRGLPLLDN